jgi:prepilin signal peptidase PulO-like enzyme (type II secretory pathway)
MNDVILIGISLIIGWCIGVPLAHFARRLCGRQRDREFALGVRSLFVDPPLQAFQAVTLALLAIRFGLSPQLVIYGALSLVLTIVLFVDLRTHFVYGVVAYPGILVGVVLSPIAQGGVFWEGLASAALGGLVFGALYLVGRLLYRGGVPLASGDIIIAALVGSIVGIGHLVPAIFLGVLFSGLLAVAYAVRLRSMSAYLPYGPGLCLGALVALLR